MTNRLEWLGSGIELENKAKGNNNEIGLKTNLEKIKKVLSDNTSKPSPEEIASAKKFLDSLEELKNSYIANGVQVTAETKAKLGNLLDEFEIFQETQKLVNSLKPTPQNSPEVIDKNSSFEKLFSETKSEMIINAKGIISVAVNDKFRDLNPSQRENIKTAITGKLIGSGIADSLIGGFSSKLKQYSELLAKKDFKSLLGLFDTDKDSAKKTENDKGNELLEMLNGQMTLINDFVQTNNLNPNLDIVLNSSKNIELIKTDTDINSFKPSTPAEEQTYLNNLKNKIKGFDKKIILAENTKEKIFESVIDLPEFVSNGMAKFIAFLATIPIIGGFIKSFLGLKGEKEDEIENELKNELESRKSIKNLKGYGIQTGKNGEKTETKNNPKIKILQDKDLSSIKFSKGESSSNKPSLENFFTFCKEKKVAVTASDFWYKVFEKKKVETTTKDADGKESKIVVYFPVNIDENDFDANKKPNENFYKKLNDLNKKKEPQTQEQPPITRGVIATVATTPAMMAFHKLKGSPKTSPTPSVETPTQVVESGDLPGSITFDPASSIATIDGKRYKVEAKKGWIPVQVTTFSIDNNGCLNISWSLLGMSSSSQFNGDELRGAYTELKNTGRFEGTKDGGTLILKSVG